MHRLLAALRSRVHIVPASLALSLAAVSFASTHEYPLEQIRIKKALEELDLMHEHPQRYPLAVQDAYDKASSLAAAYTDDAAILYRYARASFNLSQQGDLVNDPARRVALLDDALRLIRKSRQLNCHDNNILRWSGIILQSWSEKQSTAEYIKAAFEVKAEWLAAVEADPKDARAWHLLGRWAQAVSSMPYWKRSIAGALFATPPTATLTEAREYYARSESLSPGDWIDNRIGLAQCALELGDQSDAARWALAALAMPSLSESDQKAHQEALRILTRVDPVAAAAVKLGSS